MNHDQCSNTLHHLFYVFMIFRFVTGRFPRTFSRRVHSALPITARTPMTSDPYTVQIACVSGFGVHDMYSMYVVSRFNTRKLPMTEICKQAWVMIVLHSTNSRNKSAISHFWNVTIRLRNVSNLKPQNTYYWHAIIRRKNTIITINLLHIIIIIIII